VRPHGKEVALSSIDILSMIANSPTMLTAVASGRGGFAMVAIGVVVAAIAMASGMANAIRAALAVVFGIFAAMLRVSGVGIVALVVVGLLLLM
jgi:hypothetical protein